MSIVYSYTIDTVRGTPSTLTKRQEALMQIFNNIQFPDFEPNYNLVPTQSGLVITADEPSIAQQMHVGLIPFW